MNRWLVLRWHPWAVSPLARVAWHRVWRSAFVMAFVMGALAVAVFFGLVVVATRLEIWLLMLMAGGLSVVIWHRFSRRTEVGILAVFLSAGLLNFVTLPTGTASRLVISFVISLALLTQWLLDRLVLRPAQWLLPSPVNKPLLAYATISIVSYVWSLQFHDQLLWIPSSFPAVQVASLVVNLTLIFLVLLVSNSVRSVVWLKRMTMSLIAMGVLYYLLFLMRSPLLNHVLNNGTRGLFGMWVTVLAYAMALFNERLRLYERLFLFGIVLLGIHRYFLEGMSWISGWLPLGVSCIVLTALRSRQLLLVGMLIGTLYFTVNFTYYYDRIVLEEEAGGSGTGRVELWVTNLGHVAKHPLFGMGPAGYSRYNMTYHPEDARSTHNNYFDILAQTGVVGFIAFIWLMARFLGIGQRLRRHLSGQRNFEEAFACAAYAGWFGIMVCMMLGDWILPFAYNQTIAGFDNASYSWLMMGAMVALYHIHNLHQPRQLSAPSVS